MPLFEASEDVVYTIKTKQDPTKDEAKSKKGEETWQ